MEHKVRFIRMYFDKEGRTVRGGGKGQLPLLRIELGLGRALAA